MRTSRGTAVLSIAAVALLASPARADVDPGERLVRTAVLSGDYAGLPAQSADPGPQFGFAVATDGDWLAVGEPGLLWTAGIFGTASHGQVTVYRRGGGGWQLHQRLRLGAHGDSRCGHSVALSLPNLAVGCPGADELATPATDAGVVRWYRLGGSGAWSLAGGYHGPPGARCGTAVALSRDADGVAVAATGCPAWDGARGFVQVHRIAPANPSWQPLATSVPGDGAAGDEHGAAVAVACRAHDFGEEVLLAAGAPGRSQGQAAGAGLVRVLAWDAGWTLAAAFGAPQPELVPQARFGTALAMEPPQLVVGAPGGLSFLCPTGLALPRCGSVHRHVRPFDAWQTAEQGTAVNAGGTPPGEQSGMAFGAAVAIGGRRWIAVAAPQADGATATLPPGTAADVGMVELRRRDDTGHGAGNLHHRYELRPGALLPGVNLAGGRFGSSLDFGERRLAVGYPGAGGGLSGQRRGQVWIFEEDRLFGNGWEWPTVEIPPPP